MTLTYQQLSLEMRTDLAQQIGSLLRDARQRDNKTMTEMAVDAGIDLADLCRIELGRRPAFPRQLMRLEGALGISFKFLRQSTGRFIAIIDGAARACTFNEAAQ